MCQECQPFHVGSAVNGGQCDPCLDFCNGNTDVCMSRADRARTAGVTNRTRVRRGVREKWYVLPQCMIPYPFSVAA